MVRANGRFRLKMFQIVFHIFTLIYRKPFFTGTRSEPIRRHGKTTRKYQTFLRVQMVFAISFCFCCYVQKRDEIKKYTLEHSSDAKNVPFLPKCSIYCMYLLLQYGMDKNADPFYTIAF